MTMRKNLQSLARLLHEQGGNTLAVMVEDAIAGSEHELDAFLVSNEL